MYVMRLVMCKSSKNGIDTISAVIPVKQSLGSSRSSSPQTGWQLLWIVTNNWYRSAAPVKVVLSHQETNIHPKKRLGVNDIQG